MFQRLHAANGVAFRLGSRVEAIDGVHVVQAVRLAGGEVLPADLVLVGVGVEPATKGMTGIEIGPDGVNGDDAPDASE